MRRLGLFARWPEPGAVKSRLSPALPAPLACELYRAMLEDAISAAQQAAADERVLFWADAPQDQSDFPPPPGFAVRAQVGRDLGSRLSRGVASLLQGPDDRAVVIGADCPELEAKVICEAFEALGGCDLVLGPASDGGYYLLGLRRTEPNLFEDVDWGSGGVLQQTLEQARRAGLATTVLLGLSDIDSPDDLARFAARRALSQETTGYRTVAALRVMGLMPPGATSAG